MELQLADGNKKVELADTAFDRPYNESLVHQAVETWLAGARSGTRAQKSRSDVRGGGAKPWRQKGTGRARAGTSSSPLWRHGGVTFAAKPQDHSRGLNRKMYRGAMRSILSELVRGERLSVVSELTLDEPRTKALLAKLDNLGGADALIVVTEVERNLALAARNLSRVDVVTVSGINPVNLMRHERVIASVDALKKIEEWLA
ncbi:MAG: 50S ribosomal protein L4 [Halofilum sp. (in: g-proteobacteria)]|nr:50S ribosomal protein L4 [Halofilum sp. (in: g-proteobacteria)]